MVAFRSYSSQEFDLLGVIIPVLTVRQEVDVFEIIAQLLDQLAHSTELFFRQKLRISIHVAGGWRGTAVDIPSPEISSSVTGLGREKFFMRRSLV